ncbi:unnamed protein product [Coccothraustes coccothraustes]
MEKHGAALGGRRQPRGSLSGSPSPALAASTGEAGQEGGRAPLAGHLSRPPSASAAGAPGAGRRKRSGPRGRTRRCGRLLGEPRLRPAGRERPSPLLSAPLSPPTVNFPELTLSLWLRVSGSSSSSGTGRSRRRGAAPALPAGEGRSGGRAVGPGPARLGSALPSPAVPGLLALARQCRSPPPRVAKVAVEPPGARPARQRPEAPELFPRPALLPGEKPRSFPLPAGAAARDPGAAPAGRELASGLLSHCALSRGIKSFGRRHSARVLVLQGSQHNSLVSLCRVSAGFFPEFPENEWIEEAGTGTPVCSDQRKTRCNL